MAWLVPVAVRSLAAIAIVLCLPTQAGSQQPRAPLRSGVVLVPLDVRVVDANGDPVTDLTAADFTVYENDVRQEIAHFMPLSLDGRMPNDRSGLRSVNAFGQTANTHRTFIILLGRGRLNGPARGMDSVIAFVKGLSRTDRVGLVAYLRASQPSTDHGAVIRFLERYRDRHEDLEGRLRADFRRHAFDLVALSADTRRQIDALFQAGGIPTFTALPGATGTAASRYLNLNYLRRAIQSARNISGEKHLIVLTDSPLPLSRTENPDDHIMVKLANESRVSLSYINTGGLSGQTMIRGQLFISKGGGAARDHSAMGITDREFFDPGDHRTFAERTGGLSAFYQYASDPLARVDRGSRFQYLLGYYPSTASSPETYRSVRVVIDRREATARYRRGYRLAPSAADETDFRNALGSEALERALARLAGVAPRSRITSARVAAPALRIRASTDQDRGENVLEVNIAFDPMRVAFTPHGTAYRASLRLAVAVDNADGRQVGELTRSLDLELSADDYARAKKEWLSMDVTLPLHGIPARVRAATYDYDADRTMAAAAIVESSRR
jgi:VWFA-related protein